MEVSPKGGESPRPFFGEIMNVIYLMKVEFDDTYNDVIKFNNIQDQSTYFNSLQRAEYSYTNISLIRNANRVRISGNIVDLRAFNYCMYENEVDGSIMRVYAFIMSTEWIGINTVELTIKTDVYQTFLFSHTLETSFVEQAHIRRWVNGKPQLKYCEIPENFDVGEQLIIGKVKEIEKEDAPDDMYFAYVVSTEALTGDNNPSYSQWGKITTPLYIYIIPFREPYAGSSQIAADSSASSNYPTFETLISSVGKITSVISIYVAKYCTLPYSKGTAAGGNPYINFSSSYVYKVTWESQTIIRPKSGGAQNPPTSKTFDYTYTVEYEKEIKLSCYPYNFYRLSSNRAFNYDIRPQYLDDPEMTFFYTLSIGENIKEGYGVNDYLGDTPYHITVNNTINELPVVSNKLIDYLQTSKASEKAGIAGGALIGAAGGFINANPYASAVGAGVGLARGVLTAAAKRYDLSETPDAVKRAGNNVTFEANLNTLGITLYNVRLPDYQRERLKNFFNRYGYAIRDFIDIDLNSRKYWNYVKTVEARVTGPINMDYIRQLEEIYNKGVRLWHFYPTEWHGIGDYSLDNVEV